MGSGVRVATARDVASPASARIAGPAPGDDAYMASRAQKIWCSDAAVVAPQTIFFQPSASVSGGIARDAVTFIVAVSTR